MQDGLEVKIYGAETAGKAASKAWDSVANAVWRTPAKITIEIQFSTVADPWQLEVLQTDTIAAVKQQIFTKYKLASALFFLLRSK